MRSNLILAFCGALFGGLLILVFSQDIKELVLPAGSKFESVDDLRAALKVPNKGKNRSKKTASLKELLVPNPSNLIIYELAPNLDLTFMRSQVVTNSHGMRDLPRSLKKPEGVYRIAVLGDSFTFGWGVEREEAYPAVLEKELNNNSGDSMRYEVLNFGVPGYSTFQEVEQFLEKGSQFSPDAVLVFVIDNDFGLPFFIRNYDTGEDLVAAQAFHKLDQSEEKIEVESAIDPNRALEKLEDYCKEKGIKVFVTINPNKKAKGVRSGLWKARESDYIELIPLRRKFLKTFRAMNLPDKSLSLSFDPHPSPLKHEILGQLLARDLHPVLG